MIAALHQPETFGRSLRAKNNLTEHSAWSDALLIDRCQVISEQSLPLAQKRHIDERQIS